MTELPELRALVAAAEKLDKAFAAGDEYSGNLTWGQVEALHVLSEALAALRVDALERVVAAAREAAEVLELSGIPDDDVGTRFAERKTVATNRLRQSLSELDAKEGASGG